METLKDVVAQLKTNDVKQEQTRDGVMRAVKLLQETLDLEKRGRGDALEDRLEKKNKGKKEIAKTGGSAVADSLGLAGLGGISGLLASVAALGAAFAGLRGWEAKAIKEIGQTIPRFIDTFRGGVTRLVDATLKRLGFFGDMERDAKGRFTTGKAETPLNRITRGIDDFFKGKVTALDDFFKGFKPTLNISEDTTKAIARVKDVFKTPGAVAGFVFKPVIFLLEDIGKIMSSIGGMIGKESTSVIKNLVKNAGNFAGVIGRVLKPIGFIFSFVEGIQEAFKTEGDIFDKLTAGISRFVADFIGAPLDLLKQLSAFLLEKMGFENVAKALRDFSIEEALFSFVNGAFKFLKAIFTGDIASAGAILKDFFSTIGNAILRGVNAILPESLQFDIRSPLEKAQDDLKEARAEKDKDLKKIALAEERVQASKNEIARLESDIASGNTKGNQDYFLGVEKRNLERAERQLAGARRRNAPDIEAAQQRINELEKTIAQLSPEVSGSTDTTRTARLVTAGGPPNRDIVMAPDQRDQSQTTVSHQAASFPQGDSIDTHSNFASVLAGD